jgi:uncharacterized membrane protein YdjX (TVP38/TMEM64 family)
MTPDTPSETPRPKPTRTFILRIATGLFVGAVVVVLYNLGHIQTALQHIDAARAWILRHGLLEAALVFFGANTVLCALGCPRLWTSVFAGIVFGGPLGFLISWPSSLAGACLTFAVLRISGGRHFLAGMSERWRGKVVLAASPDILQTVLIRQLPIPGLATTLLLALSNVAASAYLVGSAIGFIPGAALACFMGDTVTTAQTQRSLALAASVILVSLLIAVYSRGLSRRTTRFPQSRS